MAARFPGGLAAGICRDLIDRAAEVTLKEGRTLIVVTRETPLSPIHIRNMQQLSDAGAVILPASPGFYNRPATVEDMVDFVVARILDQLNVDHDLTARWGEPNP